MSEGRPAATAAHRVASGTGRVVRAWRVLPHERRLAAYASLGLFFALFLPWYQETIIAPGRSNLLAQSATLTGWGAFSFVEAAVLLVAVGVLTLLFQRAEGRAFHLPGGDGAVIFMAGLWTCLLIVWRIFDKQGANSHGQLATTWGIEWGIFVALGVAGFLTYAGSRIRAAHRPEPPLPGERPAPSAPGGGSPAGASPDGGGLWSARSPAGAPRSAAPPSGDPRSRRRPRPPGVEPRPGRPVRPPRPVRAPPSQTLKLEDPKTLEIEDPPTLRVSRRTPPPAATEDPVAPDEQLTIPLEDAVED